MATHGLLKSLGDAFGQLWRSLRADPAARRFGFALLVANLVLILVSYGIAQSYWRGWQPDPLPDMWNISRERSVPEYLNYLQTGLCALFTLLCWRRTRVHAQLFWAATFAFIVFDDWYGYHEIAGAQLVDWLNLPALADLRPQDTGEMLAWLVAALVLAIPMLAALRQKQSRSDPLSLLLLVSFLSLVFFAVGMDMIHEATESSLAGDIEDGGEMLSMAFACSSSFAFWRALRRDEAVTQGA